MKLGVSEPNFLGKFLQMKILADCKWTIFVEQKDKIALILHLETNSWKVKVDLKFFGWA